jgi:peptide chain release factor 1
VTVAVLREPKAAEVRLNDRDLEIRKTKSGGPGGQHANKTESAVVVTHKPTGICVRVETKSQHRNKELALGILRARLLALKQGRRAKSRNDKRRSQVGSGMRADKVRTIALQRGQVTDHRTGKRISARKYLRGEVEGLWP